MRLLYIITTITALLSTTTITFAATSVGDTSQHTPTSMTREHHPASTSANQQVNINTASAEQLQSVKGIGATRAADIVAYRQANGPFKSIDDLSNVKGIGPGLINRIKSELTVQ
ncbi:MAG: ComEA family DNA-binding protein [Pseudomonadota bacterium]